MKHTLAPVKCCVKPYRNLSVCTHVSIGSKGIWNEKTIIAPLLTKCEMSGSLSQCSLCHILFVIYLMMLTLAQTIIVSNDMMVNE